MSLLYKPSKPLSRGQMAALLAMLMTIMPFSIDAYLPALLDIAAGLNADIHQVEKSLSSFMLGVAAGQLIGGSLSDIKGRRNIALGGLSVYVLASAALVFVQTADQLLVWRMVQALLRDNYQGREAAKMFALIGIIVMTAPLIAPLFGSLLHSVAGWRSIFAFLFAYAALVVFLLYRFLPQFKAAEPITKTQLLHIGTRYRNVFRNRAALGFLFYQAASFSSMIVFLSESPFVYMKLYGLSQHQYAFAFACNIITMMSFNRLTAFGLNRGWESRHLLLTGISVQFFANTSLLVTVLWLKQPALWLALPLLMCSVGAQGLIAANTQALFMGNFKPEIGGSANAVLMASQSLIASTVGFAVTWLHNGSMTVMAACMFACSIIGGSLLWYCSRHQLRKKAAANVI